MEDEDSEISAYLADFFEPHLKRENEEEDVFRKSVAEVGLVDLYGRQIPTHYEDLKRQNDDDDFRDSFAEVGLVDLHGRQIPTHYEGLKGQNEESDFRDSVVEVGLVDLE